MPCRRASDGSSEARQSPSSFPDCEGNYVWCKKNMNPLMSPSYQNFGEECKKNTVGIDI